MKKLTVELLTTEVDGFNFIVMDKDEHLQSFWMRGSYYEPDMIKFIQQNYKGGTFVDAGACIGNHTLAFSKIADNVVAFEPIQKVFLHCVGNIMVNNISNVIVHPVALGNFKGTERMTFVGPSAGGGEVRKDGEFIVPTIPLDEYQLENVKVIKMDVQEHEMEVLKGALMTIMNNKPDLYIECNTDKERNANLDYLKSIDSSYNIYPKVFNASPTYLFTIKPYDKFIDENEN